MIKQSLLVRGVMKLSTVFMTAAATDSEKHSIFVGKMVSIPAMFILVLFASLAPFFMARLSKARMIITFATCFSGGAMLGIGLMHMLPETREVWEEYLATEEEHAHDHADEHAAEEEGHSHGFPYAELLCGISILLLISVEYILMRYLERRGNFAHCHGHAHGGDEHDVEEGSAPTHKHVKPEHHDHHTHNHHGHTHNGYELKSSSSSSDLSSLDMAELGVGETNGVDPCVDPCVDVGGCNDNNALSNNDDCGVTTVTIMSPTVCTSSAAIIAGETKTQTPQVEGKDVMDVDEEKEVEVDAETKMRIDQHKKSIDAFVSALAICIHCVFNGLSMGADTSSPAQFWAFFGATVGHKMVDGFAVGVPIYRAQLPRYITAAILFTVAISSPLGVIIGYLAAEHNQNSLARAIIMGLSSGSFFFVALYELIPAGLNKGREWLLTKLLCIGIGYAVVAIVANWA